MFKRASCCGRQSELVIEHHLPTNATVALCLNQFNWFNSLFSVRLSPVYIISHTIFSVWLTLSIVYLSFSFLPENRHQWQKAKLLQFRIIHCRDLPILNQFLNLFFIYFIIDYNPGVSHNLKKKIVYWKIIFNMIHKYDNCVASSSLKFDVISMHWKWFLLMKFSPSGNDVWLHLFVYTNKTL